MEKPPFLKDSSASTAAPKDPQPNRPQEMGGNDSAETSALDEEMFPNRPQKMGEDPTINPKSTPAGGPLPFPGAPPAPKAPWKLGK